MRNLQFVALMLLSVISISLNLFNSNPKIIASEDCVGCNVPYSCEDNIKKNVQNFSQ